MPEISLKDYFARLNSLLSSGAADEVIHHSRHILQHYPKNVTAARYLGRALVLNGRWDEGRDTLRRVLSVIPDDFTAHLGLSEANERLNRPDEAIWHLERAFEQRPNDKDLIDALRGLYRRYRRIDNLKIQLTSAAVARQYLRSGAYTQAIDALRSALARLNDRLDLKLLLAQTLWQQGTREEAAEIALDVLKILPDCLEANRIMAQLWLGENRPSDAQRYVNHLEGVDPYLAVELVQGAPPDDDAFRLEELDYARTAQSEMTSARPDWLREISSAPTATTAETEAAPTRSDPSDWASAMLNAQKQPPKAEPSAPAPKAPAADGRSASQRFAAMSSQQQDDTPGMTDIFGKPEDANTGELASLFDAQPGEDDPMAWLRDTGVEIVDEDEEPSFKNLFDDDDNTIPEEVHPMAWLKEAGGDLIVEANDEKPADDDAFAWVSAEARPVTPSPDADDADDSLSWLQDDALLEEALDLDAMADPSPEQATRRMKIPGAPTEKPETEPGQPAESVPGPRRGLTAILQESNLDWINKQDDNVVSDDEMDDWLNQFGPSEERKPVSAAPDWLSDLDQPELSSLEGDEWFKPEEPAVAPEAGLPESLVLMSPDEDEDEDSDWLAEFAPQGEPPADVADTDTGELEFEWQQPAAVPDETADESPAQEPAEAEAEAAEEIPDWLSSLEPEEDEEPEAEEEQPAADLDEDEFAWMTDDVLTNAEGSADQADDWFAELTPEAIPEADAEAPTDSDGGLAWTGDTEDADAEPLTEAVPDWLADLQTTGSAASTGEFTMPDFSAEPEADEASAIDETDFSWMTAADDEATEKPAAAAGVAADDFPWMAEDTSIKAEAEAEPEAVSESPDWLSEFEPESETGEAAVAENPDWLTDFEPQAETEAESAAAAAIDTSGFAWMAQDEPPVEGEVEPESETEDAVAEAAPDWLAALEPKAAASPEPAAIDTGDFAWMDEEEPDETEAEPEPVAGDAVAEVAPDWLAELEPQGEVEAAPDWLDELEVEAEVPTEAEPAAVDTGDFAWMSVEAPNENEVEPAVAEVAPDWLSELEPPAAVIAPTPAPQPVLSDADFAWMRDDEDVLDEEEIEPAEEEVEFGETPDWLAELESSGVSSEAEPAPVDEAEAEAETADADDWMSEFQPPASEAAAPAVVASDFEWMAADEVSDEAEASPEAAVEAELEPALEDENAEPDWLGGLNLPSQETEPELAEADITWTSDELQPPADEAASAAVANIDWLSELEPPSEQDEDEFSADEIEADEEFSWLDQEQTPEPEPEPEPEPIMAVPDEEAEPEQPEPVMETEAAEPEPVMAVPDAEAVVGSEAFEADELAPVAEADEDEILEPTPAQNAPDWLNAMVPGLDVDYEAGGESAADEEAEEPAPAPAAKREFDWLVEIVEEETAASERARFVFSRPPVWLQPTNGTAHSDVVKDDLPDWPSDDTDADVPEWLR